jgi:hypothetical protein
VFLLFMKMRKINSCLLCLEGTIAALNYRYMVTMLYLSSGLYASIVKVKVDFFRLYMLLCVVVQFSLSKFFENWIYTITMNLFT